MLCTAYPAESLKSLATGVHIFTRKRRGGGTHGPPKSTGEQKRLYTRKIIRISPFMID